MAVAEVEVPQKTLVNVLTELTNFWNKQDLGQTLKYQHNQQYLLPLSFQTCKLCGHVDHELRDCPSLAEIRQILPRMKQEQVVKKIKEVKVTPQMVTSTQQMQPTGVGNVLVNVPIRIDQKPQGEQPQLENCD